MRREQSAKHCVKVVIRRLLGEQTVDVVVLGSGKKEDAMWHVPQAISPSNVKRDGTY